MWVDWVNKTPENFDYRDWSSSHRNSVKFYQEGANSNSNPVRTTSTSHKEIRELLTNSGGAIPD